jgi:hypothetical protein
MLTPTAVFLSGVWACAIGASALLAKAAAPSKMAREGEKIFRIEKLVKKVGKKVDGNRPDDAM